MTPQISRLRIRDLLLLEQLHALGSLRKAAEALHISQPAVTKVLQGLEEAFGEVLVERGSQGVQLTPAGVLVLQRVRAVRHDVEVASDAVKTRKAPVLRLGATPVALQDAVPTALAVLRTRAPQVQVVLLEATAPSLWSQLAEGVLDALVGPLPATAKGPVPPGIAFRPVGDEPMVLVAGKGNRRASKAGAEDLARMSWVLPPPESLVALMLSEWFSRRGVRPPTAQVTCSSYLCNLRMAGTTDMLCIAPRSAVDLLGKALGVQMLAQDFGRTAAPLMLAWREALDGHPALGALQGCFGPHPG